MIRKGWNQSELARRAATHMPNKTLGRDNISKYLNGATLPEPLRLHALAKALGVKPEDLIPDTDPLATDMEEAPALAMQTVDENTAWLRINQQVPIDTALQIMGLLQKGRN